MDLLADLEDDFLNFDKDNEVMEEKQVEQVPSEQTQTEDLQDYHEGTLTFGNFVEPCVTENASIADLMMEEQSVSVSHVDPEMFLDYQGDSKMNEVEETKQPETLDQTPT